jgi:hypothetical protein
LPVTLRRCSRCHRWVEAVHRLRFASRLGVYTPRKHMQWRTELGLWFPGASRFLVGWPCRRNCTDRNVSGSRNPDARRIASSYFRVDRRTRLYPPAKVVQGRRGGRHGVGDRRCRIGQRRRSASGNSTRRENRH